jgi:translation initiation factor IF-1
VKISKREKKYILICIVSVVLFCVIKFLILPFADKGREVRENIAGKEMTYKKYLAFIARKEDVEKVLADLKGKEKDFEAKLLKGDTPSLAASDLQKILEQVAVQVKNLIQSTKVMEPETLKGGFFSIPIQVRLVSDLTRARKFIALIEEQFKYLTIPELKVSVMNKADPKEIFVTMVVRGFMKGAQPAAVIEKQDKVKVHPTPHGETKPKKRGG